MSLGQSVSWPAHPQIFLDLFICCFIQVMLELLKNQRESLNSLRNAVENTNAGLASVTPASDLKQVV